MADRQESQAISKQYDSSYYEGKYDDIKRKFESFDPGPINEACNTWSQVAQKLGELAGTLRNQAGAKLSDAWDSDAAAEAQHQLQVAQGTAAALADQCMQMARATDTAYQYADWYKTSFPGAGHFTTHADHQRAVDHEVDLMERYNEVIGILPSQVQAQYVDTHPGSAREDDFTRTGGAGGVGGLGTAGGSGGGGMPHLPGAGGTHLPGGGGVGTHPPGGGSFPGGSGGPSGGSGDIGGLGSPYDTGSSLAGGGGGAGGIGAGFGPDGLGGAGAGGIGSGLGSGAGGIGSGLGPGAGGPGSGAGGFGAGGTGAAGAGGAGRGGRFGAAEPEGAGGRGAGGRGAGGTGAMPLHGGRGGDDDERERTTWLTEDEDVWGGDTDAPPPVIGG